MRSRSAAAHEAASVLLSKARRCLGKGSGVGTKYEQVERARHFVSDSQFDER